MWHIFQATADRIQRRISRMDRSLETSFINVKRDTSNLGEWVRYLNEKAQQQDAQAEQMAAEIKALNEELSAIPKTPEDIRRIIDQYYSYDSLLMRIKIIEQRVEEMVLKSVSQRQTEPQNAIQIPLQPSPQTSPQTSFNSLQMQELESIRQKLANLEQKKHTLKEKILKRITKNSKEYVKSIIKSYIRKYENVAALGLKEMVVDDQGLCSKSSFYRLMEEIEEEQEIGVVKEGKEKHYFMKAHKRQS